MKPLDIANAAWGLTKAEEFLKLTSNTSLWTQLSEHLRKKIDTIHDSHSFANILWVFSKKELGHEEFWEKAIKSFNKNAEKFDSQAFTNSIWAITKFCNGHQQKLLEKVKWDKIEEIFLRKHEDFKESEYCSLAWTFSKSREGNSYFFTKFLSNIYNSNYT